MIVRLFSRISDILQGERDYTEGDGRKVMGAKKVMDKVPLGSENHLGSEDHACLSSLC